MSAQHTPGPWRYWSCRVDSRAVPPMYDYAQFANQAGVHVFRAPLPYLSEADARLIAASPKLLAALEQIAKTECTPLALEYVQGIARAAIAAALGEQA
jgi:hypothetical protein